MKKAIHNEIPYHMLHKCDIHRRTVKKHAHGMLEIVIVAGIDSLVGNHLSLINRRVDKDIKELVNFKHTHLNHNVMETGYRLKGTAEDITLFIEASEDYLTPMNMTYLRTLLDTEPCEQFFIDKLDVR